MVIFITTIQLEYQVGEIRNLSMSCKYFHFHDLAQNKSLIFSSSHKWFNLDDFFHFISNFGREGSLIRLNTMYLKLPLTPNRSNLAICWVWQMIKVKLLNSLTFYHLSNSFFFPLKPICYWMSIQQNPCMINLPTKKVWSI